ncbi:uncharacterized protein LOC144448371 [Glandiceps talaboti]
MEKFSLFSLSILYLFVRTATGDVSKGVIACTDCERTCQNVTTEECAYLFTTPKLELASECPAEVNVQTQDQVDKLQDKFTAYREKVEEQTAYIIKRHENYLEREAKLLEIDRHLRQQQHDYYKTIISLQRRKTELESQKEDLTEEIYRLRTELEDLRNQGCNSTSTEYKYDYTELLYKSLLFYEAQRSGYLPPDNRIPWRGDSAVDDRGANGEDLSGGYYDAGDHLKLGHPAAFAAATLAWGFIEYKDAYEISGQVKYMLDCLRWFSDFFIKCHTAENEFYVQVGDTLPDHQYWGNPEDMTMARPAYAVNETSPGSDCVGGTAAAMAAIAIAFKDYDANYSAIVLEEAKSLFRFADTYRGIYSDSVPEAAVYQSNGYVDELVFASLWIYRATEEQQYLDYALNMYSDLTNGRPYAYSWDNKIAGIRLLLWKFVKHEHSHRMTEAFVDNWMPDKRLPYTPLGMVFRDTWGPLRYSAATAFIALLAADYGIKPDIYRPWAIDQMGYILGDTGRSFVCGYGVNPPQNPHHRGSSCMPAPARCGWGQRGHNSPNPNPNILYGALVGGPDQSDVFKDDRKDYAQSEVALDFNAGFQSALAALKHLQLEGLYPVD